jgi:hypothetical protein
VRRFVDFLDCLFIHCLCPSGKFWRVEVDLPLSVHHFEYKYLIFNPNTGFVQWEQGKFLLRKSPQQSEGNGICDICDLHLGPNRVWCLEVVPLNDIWEEQTASLANLSKIELAQTITTLKKVHFLKL